VDQTNGEAAVRVRDSGAGMDRTGEGADRGLGIGLTIAKKLVELHAGRIYATSEGPNQGSEFFVHLAAIQPPHIEHEPIEGSGTNHSVWPPYSHRRRQP
jgi:signal transduction histidine kinase